MDPVSAAHTLEPNMTTDAKPPVLPGEELIIQGLQDLADGRESEAALLVEIAAPRLRTLGHRIPAETENSVSAEHRLYALLAGEPARTAATTRCSRGSQATPVPPSMRPPVDREKLEALAEQLGQVATTPTVIYLTGGATAVLEGWRASTIDVDLRFEPDSDPLLRALPALKEQLQINIELASPPDFIPELPGWQERSPVVLETGNVQVRNFDPYSQALSKIERGFSQDLSDVDDMLRDGLVKPRRLKELYEQIEPELYRYPAIDSGAFKGKLDAVLKAAPSTD